MQPTIEEKTALFCIKIHASPVELEELDALLPLIQDWEKLIGNMLDRGIGPLFFSKLSRLTNRAVIPVRQQAQLQQAYYKTMARGAVLQRHFKETGEAFNANDISFVALKGIYLSEWLYGDIGLRQFSDIDVLVREQDGEKCLEILKSMGFELSDTGETEFVRSQYEIIHYPPMVKDGVSVEIHIKLHRDAEKYRLDNASLWKNAVPVTLQGMSMYALGKYDQLIHLCVHLDKHFKGGHVQFTCFMDIVNYLEKYANDFNWQEFTTACKAYDCEEEVFRYLVLCNKLMNAFLPQKIWDKYGYLITPKIESLFLNYLNGTINDTQHYGQNVPNHLHNVGQLRNLSDKVRYVRDVAFPPKAFMLQKYFNQLKINNEKLIMKEKTFRDKFLILNYELFIKCWWLLYPYRWWIGVKGVIKLIINSLISFLCG
jgi:hypothetical protein